MFLVWQFEQLYANHVYLQYLIQISLHFTYIKITKISFFFVDENTVTFRRVLKNNKEYEIHVNKLKDVNGFKRHNLIVKEKSDDNPLIYISNPVETKIPNAYLTIEGFKNLLTGRVLRQRNEFKKRPLKTYATLKTVHHTTQTNAVHFTKFKKILTKASRIKNITKTEKKESKIANINKQTKNDIPITNIRVKYYTKEPVMSLSQSDFASEPVSRANTLSKGAIEENTLTVNNIETTTIDSTRELDVSNSITSSLPVNLHTLRTNEKNTSIQSNTVENNSTTVTNISVVIEGAEKSTSEKSLTEESTSQISLSEEVITEKTTTKNNIVPIEHHILRTNVKETSIKSKIPVENNSASVTIISVVTESTLKSDLLEDIRNKTNFEKTISTSTELLTTKESTAETPTTEELTTNESTTEKRTTEKSTIEEPTTQKSTTEKLATEEPTTEKYIIDEPSTEKPTTEQFITQETTDESTTEKSTTKVLTTTTETMKNPKRKSTTEEPTTTDEPSTTVKITTNPIRKVTNKVPTTVRITTKRTTLAVS